MVDAEADLRSPGEASETIQFSRSNDLVGHQNVADAACDQHLGFTDLLAALPDRAMGDLAKRDLRALMRFGMGPEPDAMGLGEGRHGDEIALERVEIEHEGGGFDLGEALAGLGRRGKRHEVS